LIKQGAKLVESAQDILEELGHGAAPAAQALDRAAQRDAMPSRILHAAGFDPVDPDTLAMRCEIDIAALQAQLLTLELEGAIEMLPGGMIRRLTTC
jgi:DNA processing protein